ncbi:MAG TPA: ATP-dependent zinc metalloprotease FtsH [Candidatus Hydrogenedentes bacterium]|nr:ATP-dependent zinc metalloprotease FtsH [Candidatus Hydrogenedentota bacterium]HPG68498.1 ATP-dependent zinc metalloprotease FtsH [Candidatus Hydrogenedentota bacterium]
MNGFLKQVSLWIVILIIVVLALSSFSNMNGPKEELSSADFEQALADGHVEKLEVTLLSGQNKYRFKPHFNPKVKGRDSMDFYFDEFPEKWKAMLNEQKIPYPQKLEDTMWTGLLLNILPVLFLIGLMWFFMFRHMQGGSNKAMSFGKSRARLVDHSDKVVTFDDVAGVDEAKEELEEIIEFLKAPKKFTRLGGRIPKGVLLVGPPGAGKTLLARAVAGEANTPFFSISGSDFVEMFVGVGASRVRDLFQQGQKHAPCIIFIDEIDAVGRQRGAGLGGGHDEREQTLNQLLVEMDGFNTSDGVILMAATNRPDVLDHALLRPGRFDRQIVVPNPDIRGREAILKIHVRNNKVPLASDADLHTLARGTPGFSGADLANLINEAALLAARANKDDVSMLDLENAKDRVLMGPERRSMVIGEKEKRLTAYHEAGHILVGRLLPDADPIHKATVIPRGPSLGLTSWLPEEDRHNASKSYCLATIRMAMGGRAAEEVVYNEFSSGAAGDLRSATERAHKMVCEWGMSDLGPISFGTQEEVFLGRDFVHERAFSEETAAAIDREIHRILEEAYADAKSLIVEHRDLLDALAQELVEREILESAQIDEIIRTHGGADLLPPKVEPKKEPIRTEERAKAPAIPAPVSEKPAVSGAPAPGEAVPDTA